MPVTPTYPGVYIEELPSGVRTITGVATSITAFIGRTLRGSVNQPITINNFGDFERQFGGLWKESPLSYAVRDFYLNGGAQAIIVRLFNISKDNVNKAKAKLTVPGLPLEAANEGTWGNYLRARIDHDVFGEDEDKLFNLTVAVVNNGNVEQVELHRAVSAKLGHIRQVDKVLEAESQLVRYVGTIADTTNRPAPSTGTQSNGTVVGDDPFKDEYSTKVASPDGLGSDGDDLSEDQYIGGAAPDAKTVYSASRSDKKGLYALENADLFNLMCIPPFSRSGEIVDVPASTWNNAAKYCEERRAMLLIDPPTGWASKDAAKGGIPDLADKSKNAAVFFPRLRQPDPQESGRFANFVPCGAIAGIFSRTDTQRGVWKAPAGLEANLVGVPELSVPLTDAENGELNPLGVNCLRSFPAAGRIVWGSRTLVGDDRLASEWKYIPVRRLALFLEESLYRGTQWVVFEPNDEPLWAQIRLNIGAFMNNLFRQGAFQGKSPSEAYFVKCDKETTTQNDINLGIVNIIVGYAPLKPAEFVILKFQQMAGQIAT
jgi:uncharacterized protein